MRIVRFLGWVILAVFSSGGGLQAAGDPAWVWWEGESPVETNFPSTSPFSAATFPNNRDLLSGGDWLTSDGQRREGTPPLFARYEVAVPHSGAYHLWSRKFWQHGPFRWRFDDGPWGYVGRDIALADSTEIRTHLVANWVYLGQVQLDAGRHRFEFELTAKPGEPLVSAFDAFLLISGPFMPRGRLKPGERFGQADPGFFPYEPSLDPFTPDALLDLRSLNEVTAGEHGFVRYRGSQFLLGDGTPVRFWGVNISSNNIGQDRASIDYLARRLAKSGVNIVRFHSPLFDQGGNDPSRINPKALDDLFYAIAAFKREGIYTALSFYFPLWFNVRPEYGIPGYETIRNKQPFALLYFDERMQAIYKAWLHTLLTTTNPYTGRALSAEPAIAMIELINEDSFFFWTFSKGNIPAVHWQRLEALFGRWLAERYGTLRAAIDAWGGASHAGDNLEGGRAGLYEAWFMTSDGIKQVNRRRISDQVRFLTGLQRGFYEAMTTYIKEDLGSQSLIVPSNWTVADPLLLDALERYTYTAGDVIDRHGYVQGKHEGEGAGWSVRVGHTYQDQAAVTVPERLPLQVIRIDGYPHIISELGWPSPNRFRADATFLASAYASLQGINGLFFFAVGSNFLNDMSISKFSLSTPLIAGAFPAAALQYRRGDVRTPEPVVYQALNLDDLYAMKGSGAVTAQALDALRQADVPGDGEITGAVNQIDPLAFYAGPVVRSFWDDPSASRQRNLLDEIDRANRTVTGLTGELAWAYGKGLATVDTPRSQGAAGFLARAGRIELADVALDVRNEFASVMAISLDGQPLRTSRKILIQALTEEQPYGFRAENGRITDLGGPPFGVREIDATVTLRLDGGHPARVVALDENGYARPDPVHVSGAADALRIELRKDAIYHVVMR